MKIDYVNQLANFKNGKVLIVEDNDDQWVLIKQVISQHFGEVKVQRVALAEEALSLLSSWQRQEWELPKLILLDLYMPRNTDGWQFLKQLKLMPTPVHRVPVVMLTSSTSKADIDESYQLGISAYMVKPGDLAGWHALFSQLRTYWMDTITLPPTRFELF